MEKDSGSEEERLKQSRQFRINLDQLFTAVYELNSKKDDPAVKWRLDDMQRLVNEDFKTKKIDKNKIVSCMKMAIKQYMC